MSFEPNRWAASGARTAAQGDIDLGLRQHMIRVYNYMAGGLAVTGFTAIFAVYSGLYQAIYRTPLMWVVMLAPLGLALFMGFRLQSMSLSAVRTTFWAYALLLGLSIAGIFLVYTQTSIARVFFISGAMFLGTSLYGYTTKSDLSRFGSFLVMGLIGVILAGLVNIFFHSTALQFAISVISVIVFTGLTAWDTQRIKEMYFAGMGAEWAGKSAIMGALALYMDFINLFLSMLQLMGDRRN